MSIDNKYNLGLYKPLSFASNGKGISFDATEYLVKDGTGQQDDYVAFPDLAISASGKLHVVWRNGTDHNQTWNAGIMYKTSIDNGVTWSVESEIVPPPPTLSSFNISIIGISVTSTGRIVVNYSKNNNPNLRVMWSIHSDNDGVTWTTEAKITADFEPDGQIAGPFGFVEYSEGTLLTCMYGRTLATGNRGVYIYSSIDNGDTWNFYSEGYPISPFDMEEPQMVIMPNGVLAMIMRSDPNNESYYSYSLDGGLTWSGLIGIIPSLGKNPVASSPSGTLCTLGRTPTSAPGEFRTNISFSNDNGVTWNTQFIDSRLGAYMYGGIIWSPQIAKFICVYSVELGTEFIGPCEIICKHITEVNI